MLSQYGFISTKPLNNTSLHLSVLNLWLHNNENMLFPKFTANQKNDMQNFQPLL